MGEVQNHKHRQRDFGRVGSPARPDGVDRPHLKYIDCPVAKPPDRIPRGVDLTRAAVFDRGPLPELSPHLLESVLVAQDGCTPVAFGRAPLQPHRPLPGHGHQPRRRLRRKQQPAAVAVAGRTRGRRRPRGRNPQLRGGRHRLHPTLPRALTARTSKTYSRPLTRFPTVTLRVPAAAFSHSLQASPTA